MKHVIFGGDGFVGRILAAKLVAEGENVMVPTTARTIFLKNRFALISKIN